MSEERILEAYKSIKSTIFDNINEKVKGFIIITITNEGVIWGADTYGTSVHEKKELIQYCNICIRNIEATIKRLEKQHQI